MEQTETLANPTPETEESRIEAPAADTAAAEALDALRREAEQLRQELAAERRISAELREFAELYPDTPQAAIPDGVWEKVKGGIPLAAAYAMHERRQLRLREAAEAANAESQKRSSGALEGGTADMPYTAAEVRRMSADEIRRNYTAIVARMQRW